MPEDGDLFRTLTRGMYGSSMPSFRHLSEDDRWSLVQFLKTLANFDDEYEKKVVNLFDPDADRSQPLPVIGPEPPVTLESVTRGRILFIEQACVSCHQGSKPKPVGLGRWEGNFNWYDEMQRPVAALAGSDHRRVPLRRSQQRRVPDHHRRPEHRAHAQLSEHSRDRSLGPGALRPLDLQERLSAGPCLRRHSSQGASTAVAVKPAYHRRGDGPTHPC